MGALLEQLHYTWATRGIEGVNRFQVAAISDGLRSGPQAATMPVIRQLCVYEIPSGPDPYLPVSFGWLQHEDWCIAFQKVGIPSRPGEHGNFAAHFLVAPATDRTEAAFAALFDSPFWWRGADPASERSQGNGERDLELPAVRLGDLPLAAPLSEGSVEAGEALLHRLFVERPEARIAVQGSDQDLGAAMRAAAQLAPEALRGISFSSYEGRPVYPFDVVGGDGAGSDAVVAPLELPQDLDRLSRQALAGLRDGGALSRAGSEVARRSQAAEPRAELWRAIRLITELCRGGGEGGRAAVGLLAEPAVLVVLAGADAGREAILDAVQGGFPGIAAALEDSAPAMSSAQLEALCRAAGERFQARRDLRGCALVGAAFGVRAASALDQALEAALADPRVASDLPAADVVALLRRAADRELELARIEPLLEQLSVQVVACAEVPALPPAYLAVMVRSSLGDFGAVPRLAEAVGKCPALLGSLQLSEERAADLLAVLRHLAASLGPVASARWLAEIPLDGAPPSGLRAVLSQVCDELGAELLEGGEPALAAQVLARSSSDEAAQARRIVAGHPRDVWTILDAAVRGSSSLAPDPLGRAVVAYGYSEAIAAVRSPGDVNVIWEYLRADTAGADRAASLGRLLALAEHGGTPAAIASTLAWMACGGPGSKLLSPFGKLRDDELDRLVSQLRSRTSAADLTRWDSKVEDADRRHRWWWRRLKSRGPDEE